MKAHKYWSIGALITMICTFLTGPYEQDDSCRIWFDCTHLYDYVSLFRS